LLAAGAEALVRGSSSAALRLGVTPLVVGLTIVGFGTGSPEFIVSVSAALEGSSSIALGNVIGSNISNLALILGIAALVRPMAVRSEIVKREMPVMLAVTAVLWLLIYDSELSRIDGVILTVGSIGYTVLTYYLSRKGTKKEIEEFEEALEKPGRPFWIDVTLIAAGLGLLIFGAHILLDGAVSVAKLFGISEIVIGLTIIAIGTSMPELATSVVASKRGEFDVAFGNAIGSNILNILFILGVTAIIHPISAEGLRGLDLAVMMGSVLLLFFLLGRNLKLDRIEGAILVIGYFVYVYTLLPV
jgi:cation:H+ antiporter